MPRRCKQPGLAFGAGGRSAGGGFAGDQPDLRTGSELAIEQRLYPSTSLLDLLEIDEGKISDTVLYRCPERILPPKTELERHLKERCGELFGAEFDILLCDLTSTGRTASNW
jgi:hypothetical protein